MSIKFVETDRNLIGVCQTLDKILQAPGLKDFTFHYLEVQETAQMAGFRLKYFGDTHYQKVYEVSDVIGTILTALKSSKSLPTHLQMHLSPNGRDFRGIRIPRTENHANGFLPTPAEEKFSQRFNYTLIISATQQGQGRRENRYTVQVRPETKYSHMADERNPLRPLASRAETYWDT